MRFAFAAVLLAAQVWTAPASAEVQSATPGSFVIVAETTVATTPEEAWRALSRLNRWWSSQHTYSGDARRMSLDLRAGGCWCERWGGGQSAEHGRVVLVMAHEGVRTLRLVGGLGPLQEMGVSGVLTFTVAPDASGAKMTMTYRVDGDAALALDQVAPLVDMVLMEQFGRLSRFTVSGSPD